MPEMKLRQIRYETDTWKRLLNFMIDENVRLKNRISEILDDKFNKQMLEQIEIFHSNFLKEDELIGLLRNDVAELEKLLHKEVYEEEVIIEIEKKIRKLRNNITTADRQFSNLKLEFNNYLFEKI